MCRHGHCEISAPKPVIVLGSWREQRRQRASGTNACLSVYPSVRTKVIQPGEPLDRVAHRRAAKKAQNEAYHALLRAYVFTTVELRPSSRDLVKSDMEILV